MFFAFVVQIQETKENLLPL